MRVLCAGLISTLVILWGAPGKRFEPMPEEKHLANLVKLTAIPGGENAEAYFSFSGKQLIFQSTRPPFACDQIFTMDLDGGNVKLVSTGKGRTTCGYFLKGDDRILYSSTHGGKPECPPPADMSHGYVWALYKDYDIYTANADGSGIRPLTNTPGYDAEATVSPDGKHIVFTSVRDGDLELYSMNIDGTNVKRLTHEKGYDGGAFYSPDSKRIVYRAHHPTDPAEIERYERLLVEGFIEPRALEIMVMDADGSHKRQVTSNGKANFAPFFHPNGKQIIFASNMQDPQGRDFDLYLIDVDGSRLERVTYNPTFDGFPMFNKDGTKLVFGSNRHGEKTGETNVFIADWKP
jgi:TolB protein